MINLGDILVTLVSFGFLILLVALFVVFVRGGNKRKK